MRSFLVRGSLAISLRPCFPAALEDEDVWEAGVVTQAAGNVVAGLATEAAAINDDLAAGIPPVQYARQQVLPAVFVQGDRVGNVGAGEISIGPGVDPEDARAPAKRGREGDLVRLPGGTPGMPKAGCESRQKGEGEEGYDLPKGKAHGVNLRARGL